MTKEQAEKFFKRKANPDASLTPKAFMKKKMNDMVMSKGMGKVLDSKIAQKVMVPVGNKVISGTKKVVKFLDKQFVEPSRRRAKWEKERDDRWREEGEDMKAGRERYLSTNVKIRK